jgi:hypothetical protein
MIDSEIQRLLTEDFTPPAVILYRCRHAATIVFGLIAFSVRGTCTLSVEHFHRCYEGTLTSILCCLGYSPLTAFLFCCLLLYHLVEGASQVANRRAVSE